MIQQQYPSQLLEKAVSEFSKLPGIGRKTALRLVLWMLRQEDADVEQFAEAVHRLKHEVKYCHTCHNISDSDICPICADPRRDASARVEQSKGIVPEKSVVLSRRHHTIRETRLLSEALYGFLQICFKCQIVAK